MPRGRFRLSAMSTDELLTLRDNVSRAVREKISELRTQLQQFAFEARSSSAAKTGGVRRGGKVPPKYRDPDNPSNVWAGRGAEPRWMRDKIRAGAKREDFLIGASGTSPRKKRSKKRARRAKTMARLGAKVKSKRSKQTRAKPKVRRATSRKRESAAKLPQSAPTSAAPTESGA
jgi:DNA-binding protein H-NS